MKVDNHQGQGVALPLCMVAMSCVVITLVGCSNATPEIIAPTVTDVPPTVIVERTAVTEDITDKVPTVQTAPIVPEVSERARELYQAGVRAGRNPVLFTTVGDCMSASEYFLRPYSRGEYELGEYSGLQHVIDTFIEVPVREVEGEMVDSFSNPSLTVSCGFNSASPLDPLWANPNFCEGVESPLACELRVSNASLVFIMLGTHDMYNPPEKFAGYLDTIVHETVDAGAVPILVTFPTRTDKIEDSERYNQVVIDTAVAYDIPVANLWRALVDLPNYGVQADDNTKLTVPDDGCATCFTEANLRFGATVQNWVVLQTLDAVWKVIQP